MSALPQGPATLDTVSNVIAEAADAELKLKTEQAVDGVFELIHEYELRSSSGHVRVEYCGVMIDVSVHPGYLAKELSRILFNLCRDKYRAQFTKKLINGIVEAKPVFQKAETLVTPDSPANPTVYGPLICKS